MQWHVSNEPASIARLHVLQTALLFVERGPSGAHLELVALSTEVNVHEEAVREKIRQESCSSS
jgi:hypothetical protein